MPVVVSVPTRLRVDTRALRDGRRELADALAAATTRAVASSRVSLPAGSPRVSPPTFAWTGDGAAEIDTATRLEIESLCAEQIRRAVGHATAGPGSVSPAVASPLFATAGEGPAPLSLLPLWPDQASPPPGSAPVHPAPAAGFGFALAPPAGELADVDTLIAEVRAAEAQRSPGSRTAPCEPFLDEPSIFTFGPLRHELWRRIGEIADILEVDPCQYGGGFLLTSAEALLERTLDIGLADVVEAGSNVAAPDGTAVLFQPNQSVQLEALQLLASVVPLLTALTRLLEQIPEGQPLGWAPQLHERLDPQLDEVVATLFRLTCRVLFLQVLNTSRVAIEVRRADPAFEQFAELFQRAVTRPRGELRELTELRDRLEVANDVVEDAGVTKIRDRRGRLWTLEDLAAAIAERNVPVASPDPLVEQLAVLPEVHDRFRIPDAAVPGELRRLLDELFTTIVEFTLHAQADPDLGFELAHVVPADGMAMVPYTIYLLQGLHLLAHQTLSDDFADDLFYPRGINLLFDSELGARALAGPGDLGGLVTTAIVAASPVDLPTRDLRAPTPAEPEPADPVDEARLQAASPAEGALVAQEPDDLRDALRRAPAEAEPEPAEPAAHPTPPPTAPAFEPAAARELTFRPEGVAGVSNGYVMVEPASGWAPGGARYYSSAEGRRHLRLGLEARARFTAGLPGCRGWRCVSGGSALDAIAASVVEEIRADDPALADRIELGSRT